MTSASGARGGGSSISSDVDELERNKDHGFEGTDVDVGSRSPEASRMSRGIRKRDSPSNMVLHDAQKLWMRQLRSLARM